MVTNKKEIWDFNSYIKRQLLGKIDSKIPFDIEHHDSRADRPLQAVDYFSWGIFRKYERDDREWNDFYQEKISYDDVYLQ